MRIKFFILLAAIFCMISLTASAAEKPNDEILIAVPTDGHSKLPLLANERINTQVTDGISDWEASLMAGAYYLRDMQADVDTLGTTLDNANNGWDFDGSEATPGPDDPDDAGWNWSVAAPLFHHTAAASSSNLYGPCCLGIYDAYIYDGSTDATLFRAMEDAADVLVLNSNSYAMDTIFLLKFGALTGDPTYTNAAQAKWDSKFVAGGGTHVDATAYAEAIRDLRAGQGYENGIIPWDIAGYVRAAQALHGAFPGSGYDSDADDMAEVVYQDVYNDLPGYFDLEDDKYNYWFNLGVGGVIDCFQIAGVHTGELPALLDLLLESQDPSGAFTYYYQYSVGWQTTAYAIQTLSRFGNTYRQQMGMACEWLALTQDSSGGFVYSSGTHYPEICGENVSGLVLNGASSSDITGYTGTNAYMVVHNNSLWYEMKGSRHDAGNDWALFGVPCDGSQFSINVPEYGNVWNTPWDPTSLHNFSDWEKFGFQLTFGPDAAGNLANVWRREDADPEAIVVGTAEWVLSYYSTGQCPPSDPYNQLDSTASIWLGGTVVHSILYGSVENLGVEVTGSLGCSGSTIRFTGRLANDAAESPDERYEYFGFGNHPDEASVDSDYVAKSDVVGYDFDFTVQWDHNVSGDYFYSFPADTGVTLDAVTATPNTLGLTVTSGTCVNTTLNPTITVDLEQMLLTEPARGFQAFTLFDNTLLTFSGGTYTSVPYGLPVIDPIAVGLPGDDIYVASGIFDFIGQTPTEDDAVMATLTFDASGTVTGDSFAFTFDFAHDPPNRFSDISGLELSAWLQDSATVTVDNDDPVITCPSNISVDNDATLCSAEVCVGTATATDVGCGVATIVGTRDDSLPLADPYPAGCPGVTTITWVATDYAGNTATCDQTVSVTDAEDPVISGCPGNITVNADAGVCTAVVDWVPPTADDNCGVVSFTPSHNPFDTFPSGTTTVTYIALDACGNSATCTFTVTVDGFNEMVVDLTLSPTISNSVDRCITFELYDCSGTHETVQQVISFDSGGGMAAPVTVLVPCDTYTCVTARDELHTLSRTLDSLSATGTQYVATFTNPLIGGNLNDDEWIDILDFGVFSSVWNADYGTGDTDCSTAYPHADIDGDAIVDSDDFTFIRNNFLNASDADCCSGPSPLGGSQPVVSISVKELNDRGLSELAAGDLNNDGLLDQGDVVAFLEGARPNQVGVGGVHRPLTHNER